jgi:aminoglycoside phosphotransferase (APT) family kinase protein
LPVAGVHLPKKEKVLSDAIMAEDPMANDDPAACLLGAARRAVPSAITVQQARRLSSGANQETWAFDVERPDGITPLILRRARGGYLQRKTAIGLEAEASVIIAAHANSVVVPEVLYVLQPDDGLGTGFLMRRIDGETIPRKILRDAQFASIRDSLARQCGKILATIHAVPTAALPQLARFTPSERVEWLSGHQLATEQVRPVFSYAFRWLRANIPAVGDRLSLVHGDFRNGNLIIGPEGIRAVLDWENAHLGDPAEDLGWLCVASWRFGNLDRPVGGFGSREDLLTAYNAAGGVPIDVDRLLFWEVYGSLYWGIVCCRSVAEFRDGKDPSVERAMIARRASETEIDLLRLIAPRDRNHAR